jgi:hypothetical protein
VSAVRVYEALALHLAWLLMTVLRFAGIIIVIAGVALFGVYFIGGNARAADGRVPVSSWLGVGPKKGDADRSAWRLNATGCVRDQFFHSRWALNNVLRPGLRHGPSSRLYGRALGHISILLRHIVEFAHGDACEPETLPIRTAALG